MMHVLVLNPITCDGCRACEVVCSLHHENECNPRKSRIKVVKREEEGIFTPVTCLHCSKALCVDVCPMKALNKDPETGAIVLDEDVCIGCKLCLYVCPISAPRFDPEKGIIVKCDLCDGDPTCVKFCSREAVQYVPADRLDSLRKRSGVEKLMDLQSIMTGAQTESKEEG